MEDTPGWGGRWLGSRKGWGHCSPAPKPRRARAWGRRDLGLGAQMRDARDAGGASGPLSRCAEAGPAASKRREAGLELGEPEAALEPSPPQVISVFVPRPPRRPQLPSLRRRLPLWVSASPSGDWPFRPAWDVGPSPR